MRLAQLAPVGLDELVERAGLLERIDRKYVIAQAALPSLIAATPAGTRALEIAGRRSHGYRSIYLDTEDLTSYHLAGQRRRRRWKVRGRTYLDSGGSWLEVPGPDVEQCHCERVAVREPDPGRGGHRQGAGR